MFSYTCVLMIVLVQSWTYLAKMQAFYIPWGDELHRWALTHPEYTQSQILMLVTCIAESNSLKRKDRNALTSQIEADLADMQST